IPHINFTYHPHHSSWIVNYRQFLLHAAYAITFNGCQGLTLVHTILDLLTDLFTHGQLYMVLLRVRT
ncbi:hypothetical protein BDR06DRAFT_869940, partial [Suillus hirtellus]